MIPTWSRYIFIVNLFGQDRFGGSSDTVVRANSIISTTRFCKRLRDL
jgi:hypothetical protein